MTYILTQCKLPEDLLTRASHKRFQTAMTRVTAAGVGWDYSFGDNMMEIRNAPAGLDGKLATYGKVEVMADATVSSM